METTDVVIEELRPFAGANGTCNNAVALDYLNKSRRLLWNKVKEFAPIMDYFTVCCTDGCFYLPSAYKQIHLAWIGRNSVSIGDEWYMSLPKIGMPDKSHSCHQKLIQVGGFHVTFQNYDEAPYQVGIQGEHPHDNGKEITFFGVDEYGTSKKETIVVGAPPTRTLSTYFYSSVNAIIKPITSGRIRLYAVDRQAEQYLLQAVYQPYDKNPQFRKYAVQGGCSKSVTVYAKQAYHEITDMDDLVEFPTEALKFATMALVAQKDRDAQSYANNVTLAIGECNSETSDNETPTASPLRAFLHDHPENLIRY